MLKTLWSGVIWKPSTDDHQPGSLEIDGIEVIWRKSARRTRSLALKLDRQGQLIAMTPMATRPIELRHFVRSRKAWISKQLMQYQRLQAVSSVERGQFIWYLGQRLAIESRIGPTSQTERVGDSLHLAARRALSPPALERKTSQWLRDQAAALLPDCLEALSLQTGMRGLGLQIKSYTARWGSCRHDGLIQLNWKLIKTPPEVIDYVIIHELSHLSHFNHSPAFWDQVALYCPEYPRHRSWLKEHSRLLT